MKALTMFSVALLAASLLEPAAAIQGSVSFDEASTYHMTDKAGYGYTIFDGFLADLSTVSTLIFPKSKGPLQVVKNGNVCKYPAFIYFDDVENNPKLGFVKSDCAINDAPSNKDIYDRGDIYNASVPDGSRYASYKLKSDGYVTYNVNDPADYGYIVVPSKEYKSASVYLMKERKTGYYHVVFDQGEVQTMIFPTDKGNVKVIEDEGRCTYPAYIYYKGTDGQKPELGQVEDDCSIKNAPSDKKTYEAGNVYLAAVNDGSKYLTYTLSGSVISYTVSSVAIFGYVSP